jgi:hypothetical protein
MYKLDMEEWKKCRRQFRRQEKTEKSCYGQNSRVDGGSSELFVQEDTDTVD